jgi:putative transposase
VFGDPSDREFYLVLLEQACRPFGLDILAYCLMTNHVHFVAIPRQLTSINRVFHRVHGVYAQHFNAKYDFVGHLWQSRPYSCVLDGPHVLNAVKYVERNPVRAGMVARAEDYSWSSAAAHCGLREDSLLAFAFEDWPSVREWSASLAPPELEQTAQMIRHCTSTGKPCGDDAFLQTVSKQTGRDLMRKKPGPKPRESHPTEPGLDWTEKIDVRR